MVSETTWNPQRHEQLNGIAKFDIEGVPLLIHGSIGHSALMGSELPTLIRPDGSIRDTDLFSVGNTKTDLEDTANIAGLAEPCPLDAGLCGLLLREGSRTFVSKDGIVVELADSYILDEIRSYEIPGLDGVEIKSFSPEGMLAVHMLEPEVIRPSHLKVDWLLKQ